MSEIKSPTYSFDSYFWFELMEEGCKPQLCGPYLTEGEANKTYKAYMVRIEGRI